MSVSLSICLAQCEAKLCFRSPCRLGQSDRKLHTHTHLLFADRRAWRVGNEKRSSCMKAHVSRPAIPTHRTQKNVCYDTNLKPLLHWCSAVLSPAFPPSFVGLAFWVNMGNNILVSSKSVVILTMVSARFASISNASQIKILETDFELMFSMHICSCMLRSKASTVDALF